MTCQARQYSDQMQCGACGLQWDINDPEPPACGRSVDAVTAMRERLEVEDVVHTCSNCESNKIYYCEFEKWTTGPGSDPDALALLMNVDNSKCTKWRLKR